MPVNSKNGSRRGAAESEKSRRGKLPEKSMSFHGRSTISSPSTAELRRPKTLLELLSKGKIVGTLAPPLSSSATPRLTKLLLNVTVQGSAGAVQIIMLPDATVGDLISASVRQYVKEGRRPFLPASEPSRFDLHYSQFSLESIGRDEKLISLGSRNFFLCSGKSMAADGGATPTCSKEAEKVTKTGFQWLKFMGS
ncbi:PREDICTED: uncharacterized protein At4g22758-like [Tarenaya hassleriana]|uniref:uncharacterized protein At4g22758-like n=1 Tax=Tarenaya hassleriana TaxID=28532 RepID=UPI00053C5954|nr:PREDICTED: uncharacterized protein At4g22758-like [Tarenaya hassleriana]